MDTSSIKKVTNSISPIDEESWNAFEGYFSVRSLKKNEILWDVGDICKHVVFINKGLIRVYYFSEEKEITAQFLFEGQYLTDYYSFISQKPCPIAYAALEETEIITIPRPAVYQLYDKYKVFERFGRVIAEQNFLWMQQTQLSQKGIAPEDKYLNLVKERPNVMERVPLNMIASYLNMTPEHLSRIRKKVAGK